MGYSNLYPHPPCWGTSFFSTPPMEFPTAFLLHSMEFPTLFTPLPWNFQHFLSIFNPLLGISSPKMPPSMEFSIWKKMPSPHGIFRFLNREGGGADINWNSPITFVMPVRMVHTNFQYTVYTVCLITKYQVFTFIVSRFVKTAFGIFLTFICFIVGVLSLPSSRCTGWKITFATHSHRVPWMQMPWMQHICYSANQCANVIDNLKHIYSVFKNHFRDAVTERQNCIKCSEISTD